MYADAKHNLSYWVPLSCLATLTLVFVISLTRVNAQDISSQPLALDEIMLGDINLSRMTSSYTFDYTEGESLYLRTQSLTPDFAVAYRLTDANGQMVAEGTHANGQPGNLSIIDDASTGPLTIQMQSANGAGGQYMISLEAEPKVEMPSLPMGELVSAHINTVDQTYVFNTAAEGTDFLMFQSPKTDSNISFTLKDAATDEIIAMFRPDISGICIRLASDGSSYALTLASETSKEAEPYQMMVWHSETGEMSCPSSIFNAPEPDPAMVSSTSLNTVSNQTVMPRGVNTINLRAAPTTHSNVIGTATPGTEIPVIGKSPDGVWLMVNLDGTISWVATSVTKVVTGTLNDLPVINVAVGAADTSLVDVNGGTSNSALIGFNVNHSNTAPSVIQADVNTSDPSLTVTTNDTPIVNVDLSGGSTAPIVDVNASAGDASVTLNVPVVDTSVTAGVTVDTSAPLVADVNLSINNTPILDVNANVSNVVPALLGGK